MNTKQQVTISVWLYRVTVGNVTYVLHARSPREAVELVVTRYNANKNNCFVKFIR